MQKGKTSGSVTPSNETEESGEDVLMFVSNLFKSISLICREIYVRLKLDENCKTNLPNFVRVVLSSFAVRVKPNGEKSHFDIEKLVFN